VTETVLPAFLRYPNEGLIIGRILAGYGELEFEMCECLFTTNNDVDLSIKHLFSQRGELRRIKIADGLMRTKYADAGLGNTAYESFMADMDWCRGIRNQYAHCNWYDKEGEGLSFVDLEATANLVITNKRSLGEQRCCVDVALLIEQESFFKYVQRGFWYLAASYREKAGGPCNEGVKLPPQRSRPRKYNKP
jgi:hypothetical protein